MKYYRPDPQLPHIIFHNRGITFTLLVSTNMYNLWHMRVDNTHLKSLWYLTPIICPSGILIVDKKLARGWYVIELPRFGFSCVTKLTLLIERENKPLACCSHCACLLLITITAVCFVQAIAVIFHVWWSLC